jgi:hypothetical protein
MRVKTLSLAAVALLFFAGAASAATITNDLNLRRGPGTRYSVIDTMPAGSSVRLLSCGGSWCRVAWNGIEGYASRSYISGNRPVYAAAPPPAVVVGPGYGYGYDYGWGPAWGPGIEFGIGFGGGWRHDGWHGHRRWRHR